MSDLKALSFEEGATADASPSSRSRLPRLPVQERSQERVAKALAAADRLLLTIGPERLSIPEVAKEAGVPRASLYQWYPDKYALLSHLSHEHMREFARHAMTMSEKPGNEDWRAFLECAGRRMVLYYNEHPVTAMLLLGGPYSSADREKHFAKDATLATWFREELSKRGLSSLPEDPDTVALTVEIGSACFSYGYSRDGRISEAVFDHTLKAAIAYLSIWE